MITNLPKDSFSRLDIGELYNYRWGIESAFLDLKYAVHVEDFMSKKENAIKQEFYASLIQANLTMLFAEVANQVIMDKKRGSEAGIRGEQTQAVQYCTRVHMGLNKEV